MNVRVEFNVTRHCNKKCDFCYIKQRNGNIEIKKLKEYVEIFRPNNVVLTGGEALLHPDIINIFEYLYSKKVKIALFTNCLLVNKQLIKKLASYKVSLQVSYPERDKNILNILKDARLNDLKIITSTILKRETMYKIKEILNDLKDFDMNAFLYPTPINRYPKHKLIYGEEWNEMTNSLFSLAKENGNNIYYELSYVELNDPKDIPDELKCSAGGNNVVFIDSDGRRLPCCLMSDLFENKKISYQIPKCNICGGGCTALKIYYNHDPRCRKGKFVPICPLLLVNEERKKFSDKGFVKSYFHKGKKYYTEQI